MNHYCKVIIFMLYAILSPLSWAQNQNFVHPGIFVSSKQLDFVKKHLNEEPWKSAYTEILSSPLADLDYKPTPWETVECGSYSNPNYGCTDEKKDSQAAYTQALLWRYTNNTQYAENVRHILNAWANTLTGGHKNSNGPLQAAWSAQLFTRAAEIVKYTYAGWPQPEKDKVTRMFAQQYLPDIKRMFSGRYSCHNKNWHASGIEAMLNIAIFNKNTSLFNDAISKWRSLVPSYIYLESDGPRPRDASWCSRNDQQIVTHWHTPSSFVDGLSQETCRDFDHTAYGLAAIINTAETARLQGIDLYSEARERITKTMELHAKYQNESDLPALCKGSSAFKGDTQGTFEVGYNQYALKNEFSLPQTSTFLEKTRPTKGHFHYQWETLTHGLTGDVK